MYCKVFLILIIGLHINFIAASQRVKRNGVEPMDVSKNKRQFNAGINFRMDQLVGKWQEINRSSKNISEENIKDTLFLNFISNTKVITRDGNNANLTGETYIEPGNVLIAASDIYTIKSISDSQLIFDNQEGLLHTFKKTNEFYFETLGKLSVTQDVYRNPVPVTIDAIIGNWSVYKREAKPGSINPPTNIIKNLKIIEATADGKANGEIAFYQTDKTKLIPCSITLSNLGIEFVSGDFEWKLLTYKISANEFIFGDADVLLYYARRL